MVKKNIYGIGVDIARIDRLEQVLNRYGLRFLKRAFHPIEIEEYYSKNKHDRATYLASRWAVKEATFKAFQRYRILFPDIYITKRSDEVDKVNNVYESMAKASNLLRLTLNTHSPQLIFAGETMNLANDLMLTEPLVSISHDDEYAIAYVILQQQAKDA